MRKMAANTVCMKWEDMFGRFRRFYLRISNLLTLHDRRFLGMMLVFSVFVSFVEMIGVAAIMPFVSVAGDFSQIESKPYFAKVSHLLNLHDPVMFVATFGCLLILFYLLRSGINLTYFYLLSKFSKGRYHLIAYRLFENYIERSYSHFLQTNSSVLSKTIISEALNLTTVLSALLLMMSEMFVVMFIYTLMLYVNWKVTLALSLILGILVVVLLKGVSPYIKRAGVDREEFQQRFYEIMNAAFGNFKMIKLKVRDQVVVGRFKEASYGFAKASIVNETLAHAPRLFLEAIGFSIVVALVTFFVIENNQDASAIMGMLSMFVLGLYRLMPSANRIVSAYNSIVYYSRALEIVSEDLAYEPERLGSKNIEFKKTIELKNIVFSYEKDKPVINGISLSIFKGDKIGLIGESGSGKSTLTDILMGLYRPDKGEILIDGTVLDEASLRSWRGKIGYIPQQIYLFDGTVAENIAFDAEYNEKRVQEVLHQADMLEFLESEHEGIHTHVGENGIKLSGGQKQRIAIARAFYDDPELLVLDEATSALDSNTEERIMSRIYDMCNTKTLIIIAHRLSTLERCDKIYQIENGQIVDMMDRKNATR
jgi:ABC-type multidrug transport system fused ATPase/permease subunit